MEILTYKSKKGNDATVVYGDTKKYSDELKKAGAKYNGRMDYPGKAKGAELERLTKSSWFVPDDKVKVVTKLVKAHPIKKKGAASSSSESVEEKKEKKTDKKKVDKKSTASSESEEEEHAIADYSEKVYALFGDFDKWADELKKLGKKSDFKLIHPETGKKLYGWIFNKSRGNTMEKILDVFPRKMKVRVLKTIPHAFSLANIDSAKLFDLLNYLRDADLLAQAKEESTDKVFLAGLKLLAKAKAIDSRLGDIFLQDSFDKYYLMSDSDIVRVFIDQEIPYLHGLGKVTASLLAYAASLEDEEETVKIVKLVKEIEPRFNL